MAGKHWLGRVHVINEHGLATICHPKHFSIEHPDMVFLRGHEIQAKKNGGQMPAVFIKRYNLF